MIKKLHDDWAEMNQLLRVKTKEKSSTGLENNKEKNGDDDDAQNLV